MGNVSPKISCQLVVLILPFLKQLHFSQMPLCTKLKFYLNKILLISITLVFLILSHVVAY